MGQLAMGPVDLTPLFGDGQDLDGLPRHECVHGDTPGSPVLQGADVAQAGPPAVHPVIGHTQQSTRPGVPGAGGDRLVDQLEDPLLGVARDPRGSGELRSNRIFPAARPARPPGP